MLKKGTIIIERESKKILNGGEAMEDSRIIDLFFERSEQAITELSKKYGAVCGRVASNILNDRLDTEECVNDAYLAVWNTIPPQRPASLSGYVCRIVRNLALKKYHFNTAQKRNSTYDVALDEIQNCFSSESLVEEETELKDLSKAIDSFLEALDKQSRILFVRRYFFRILLMSFQCCSGQAVIMFLSGFPA